MMTGKNLATNVSFALARIVSSAPKWAARMPGAARTSRAASAGGVIGLVLLGACTSSDSSFDDGRPTINAEGSLMATLMTGRPQGIFGKDQITYPPRGNLVKPGDLEKLPDPVAVSVPEDWPEEDPNPPLRPGAAKAIAAAQAEAEEEQANPGGIKIDRMFEPLPRKTLIDPAPTYSLPVKDENPEEN